MYSYISPTPFTLLLFAGILVFLEAGRQLGLRRRAKVTEADRAGLGAIEGAVFALWGLILAFAFSGAASRLDARRALIAEEVNAIGTAYLRIDLLAPAQQAAMRDLFRKYVDSRLAVYGALPDLEAAKRALAQSNGIQAEIWKQANGSLATTGAHPSTAVLLLPALNQMFDITTTRTMAALIHPPNVIYYLLFFLGLCSAVFAGYASAVSPRRSWFHIVGFSAVAVITVFIILDLEYPRRGFITIDQYDQFLVDLRDSMK